MLLYVQRFHQSNKVILEFKNSNRVYFNTLIDIESLVPKKCKVSGTICFLPLTRSQYGKFSFSRTKLYRYCT